MVITDYKQTRQNDTKALSVKGYNGEVAPGENPQKQPFSNPPFGTMIRILYLVARISQTKNKHPARIRGI